MSTGDTRVNLFNRRILGVVDLKTRLLDFLESHALRAAKAITTGASSAADRGAWFDAVTVTDGGGINDITFGDMYGVNGLGEIFDLDSGDILTTDVPFEDAAATTFYMGAQVAEYPSGVVVNVSTGTIEYDAHIKQIGHKEEPSAVVSGVTFLTATLANHELDPADDLAGRTAIIWLKVPKSSAAATAIETVTVAAGNLITTTGTLGQTVISTTASDYEVIILGPNITRDNITNDVGMAFLGTVVGGGGPRVFDTSGQRVLNTLINFSDVPREALSKGWITRPTVNVFTVGVSVSFTAAPATVLVNGRLVTFAPSTTPIAIVPTTEQWISYSITTGTIAAFATWDLANAAGCVPVLWIGDASGVDYYEIGRYIKQFDETLTLTVSQHEEHRAAYRNLGEALAAAKSVKMGSGIFPKSTLIEIIGEVIEPAQISGDLLDDFHNVTIQGRAQHPWSHEPTAQLKWTFAGSLFNVLVADMSGSSNHPSGWTWRDLYIMYNNAAPAAGYAFLEGDVNLDGWKFYNVTVDGTNSVTGFDGDGLAYFLKSSGGFEKLEVIGCHIVVTDLHFSLTGGALLAGFRLEDNFLFQNIDGGFAAEEGIIRTENTTGFNDYWVIKNNRISTDGLFIKAKTLINSYIDSNNGDGGKDFIRLGDETGAADNSRVYNIHITNNNFELSIGNNLNGYGIHIAVEGPAVTPRSIHITNNNLVGEEASSTFEFVGIKVDVSGSDGDDAFGVMINGNSLIGWDVGIELDATATRFLTDWIVCNNIIVVDDEGIRVAADGVKDGAINGNVIKCSDTTSIALNLDGTAHVRMMISGNICEAGSGLIGRAAGAAGVGQEGITAMGNRFSLIGTTASEKGIVVDGVPGSAGGSVWLGNSLYRNGTSSGDIFSGDFGGVVCGNAVFGSAMPIVFGDVEVVVGNAFRNGSTVTTEAGTDDVTFVGNLFGQKNNPGGSVLALNTGSNENTWCGNTFRAASGLTFNGDRQVIVGNNFYDPSNGVVTVSGDDNIVAGNITRTALVDTGTSNSIGTNEAV